jgi:hypothetical protein
MTGDGEAPRVLEFTEFAVRYADDAQFRRWFAEAAELFTLAHPDHPLHWDRLIAAGACLRNLTDFLDPRATLVSRQPAANLDLMCSEQARRIVAGE